MKCFECGKQAIDSNDVVDGIKIRVCSLGHRTGQASMEMIKQSAKWLKAAKKMSQTGIIDYSAPQGSKDVGMAANDC